MENIDIRKYVINNFKDENIDKIKDSIESTIKFHNEDALIGLGVLFELLWNKLDANEKDEKVKLIYNSIKEANLI